MKQMKLLTYISNPDRMKQEQLNECSWKRILMGN